MCQELMDLGSQIEEMVRQGMPEKFTKTAKQFLEKKISNNINNNNNSKICSNTNCKNRQNKIENSDEIEMLSALNETTNQENDLTDCKELQLYTGVENKVENLSAKRVESVAVPSDILAISTQWFKKFLKKIDSIADKIQKTHRYKVLSKSTQPAHVIAVGVLSIVLLSVWPNIIDEETTLRSKEKKSGLALVAYLGAFATHFGTQIWMTFVSGLSLYFSLPRHTFGLCQQILFPKYFALNSILSISTLILFVKVIGGRWEFSTYVQVIALTLCAVIEVAVRLYLAPPLLRLMVAKHKFEKNVGSGEEIGELMQGSLVNCPHYQQIHKSFRRIHMTVAMGNLTVLVCTFLHLHYLASKISVC